MTRIGLERELSQYAPKRMSEQQKRKQEEVKKGQEVGKRSAIQFQSGRSGHAPSASVGAAGARDSANANASVSAPESAATTAERKR